MLKHKSRAFLKENIAWILLGPMIMIIGAILSVLYEVSSECLWHLCAMVMIVELIIGGIQYKMYKNAQESSEEEDNECEQNNEQWQSAREKEDFFGLWAHQIKTPIAALNLLLQAEEKDTAACRKEVFCIETYVEMALNYLRFESMSNDLTLSVYSLESMVRQVVRKYASVFIHKNISVELTQLEYQVLTDEKWFCFSLEQLLSNALKYTQEGKITISAAASGDEITLTIADTGIGIRSEDIPRIFEKGFTGYNGRMDKKASGLGLYLSKGVCDKLGHHIQITSKEGRGTEVSIIVKQENVKRADLIKE